MPARLQQQRDSSFVFRIRGHVCAVLIGGLIGGQIAMAPLSAPAMQLPIDNPDVVANWDNTVSVGASWRLEDQDQDLIGRSNGGNANSINFDNGNLNYDKGDLWSAPIKLTSELDIEYNNYALFMRGLVFYDFVIMDSDVARKDPITGKQIQLSPSAERLSGYDWRLLDAFISGDYEINDMYLNLRAGNMVLNWGESTFIQNGINIVNPVEVSALRLAGSEIKEALKPLPMLNATLSVTEKLSFEGFYQFAFRHTDIEPEGTFLSANDFASPGGHFVMLGFGNPLIPDSPSNLIGTGANNGVGVVVSRGADRDGDDQGQFGLAMRYFEPALNDTEFGFYWLRVHSRLPLLSVRTGTPVGLATGDYAASASYFREFPEDLNTLGVSFSTEAGTTGIALQGDLAYAIDRPIQVDDVTLLFAALTPLAAVNPDARIFGLGGLGVHGFDEEIRGWKEKDVLQYQMTATKLFGPTLGADQAVLLGEAGLTYVIDLENEDTLAYEGPGTTTHGNSLYTLAGIQPATQTEGFADDFSWGYRLLGRLEYNNAIGPVALLPRVAFAHDVNGTTPGPGGNFVSNRKRLTAAITANYQNVVRGELSYTSFFGGDEFNVLSDRDFISISASYSF